MTRKIIEVHKARIRNLQKRILNFLSITETPNTSSTTLAFILRELVENVEEALIQLSLSSKVVVLLSRRNYGLYISADALAAKALLESWNAIERRKN